MQVVVFSDYAGDIILLVVVFSDYAGDIIMQVVVASDFAGEIILQVVVTVLRLRGKNKATQHPQSTRA